jgi:transposase
MTESGTSDGFATLLEAWCLLLKNAANLDPEEDEKKRLREALKLNEPLAAAYYLKEDLRRFSEQPGKQFATTFLDG